MNYLPERLSVPDAVRRIVLRLIKSPLLGRYVLDWQWPSTADRTSWEQVEIISNSGALLAALYGAARSTRKGVVVCAHPLRRDAKGFFLRSGRADLLRRNGYDVLLFDFNGFGASSIGGFNYVDDVVAAARFARQRAGRLPVHALAVCFGTVWVLCAETQEALFDAIVAEAPLTTLHDYYAGKPFAAAFLRLLWRVFPAVAAKATPIDAAAELAGTVRLLLIGGMEDRVATIDMCRRLYDACSLPRAARDVWYVNGARHLRAFEAAPQQYEARVLAFLGAGDPFPSNGDVVPPVPATSKENPSQTPRRSHPAASSNQLAHRTTAN